MTSVKAMFRDLYDYISLWFSWRWPKAEDVITGVFVSRGSRYGDQPTVVYEFSVDNDGPCTGESRWFDDTVYLNGLVGQAVTVRYPEGRSRIAAQF